VDAACVSFRAGCPGRNDRCRALLVVPVRRQRALVTAGTPPAASGRTFLLHGCRVHAAGATWLGQPRRSGPVRVVPERPE